MKGKKNNTDDRKKQGHESGSNYSPSDGSVVTKPGQCLQTGTLSKKIFFTHFKGKEC